MISPVPQKTIEYFGASGAWWPNDLNLFPPEQQLNLSQLLFSNDWLYLSGYRYNMGASGDSDKVVVKSKDVPISRGVESFMNTNGSLDWTRDEQGIYYLKAAVAANVSSITFFVNAAPSGLNATSADLSPCGGTLESTAIPAFVEYVETVLAHWADQGIKITYISPMNEPDDSFSSCTQEGMAVQQSDRSTVFQQLRSALSKSKSPGAKTIKVIGDETSQIASQALPHYEKWLPATLTAQSLDAIAVHMYDFPDDATLQNYAQLVRNLTAGSPPPPIHMTEVSSFKTAPGIHHEWGWTGPGMMFPQYDPSISSALDLARMIWQWLTLVNASSFSWWTAVSTFMPICAPDPTSAAFINCGSTTFNDTGWNDALIYISPTYAAAKDYRFHLTKRFWVYKHFTTFHRPGAIRHDVPNALLPYGTVAVASQDPNSNTWSATFINRNDTAQDVIMKPPETGAKVSSVIQTTDSVDWGNVALPIIDAAKNEMALTLPARGVLTVQFVGGGPLSSRQFTSDKSDLGKRQTTQRPRRKSRKRKTS